jgi:uncharacterized caspase-like protein
MRKSILGVIAAAAFAAGPQAHGAAERLALVIGNRNYAYSPLENPLNDARDVRARLESLGFEVMLKENADLQAMEKAVEQFGNKLRGRQAGLFYYSGHGVQYDGENFLIPVDNANLTENSLKYKALNLGLLLDTMKNAAQPVSLVILDACRDNPFRGFRALGSRGLANVSGPAGSLIAFATAPGQTAADGVGGRNGTYTKHFLAHLGTPEITVEELFKRVRRGVGEETRNRQVTWENSSLSGDFCFVNCPGTGTAKAELESLQEQNRRLEERLRQAEREREATKTREERLAQVEAEERRLRADIDRLVASGDADAEQAIRQLLDKLKAVRRDKAALGQGAPPAEQALQKREDERLQKLLEEKRKLQASLKAQREELRKREQERLQAQAEARDREPKPMAPKIIVERSQPVSRGPDLPPAF